MSGRAAVALPFLCSLLPSLAAAQPYRVADIAGGTASAPGTPYTWAAALDDVLLFAASDGSHGLELWRSDGSEAGTRLVRDIAPGDGSSSPGGEDPGDRGVRLGASLYFHARTGSDGLWKTDGSAVGTVLVSSRPGGFGHATRLDDALLVGGGQFGRERLWRSAGDDASTQLLTSFYGVQGSITLAHGKALLSASDGTGSKPWLSNGEVAGHQLLSASAVNVDVSSGDEAVLDGVGVFIGNGTLWKSDGTSAGTGQLSSVIVAPRASASGQAFVRAGEQVFFAGSGTGGTGLWKTDCSVEGTSVVRAFSGFPRLLCGSGANVFFVVGSGSSSELWMSDGTQAGTVRLLRGVRDITALYALDAALYLSVDDGVHGLELWSSDGTSGGTALPTSRRARRAPRRPCSARPDAGCSSPPTMA